MEAVRARWSTWSFLVYAGGLALALSAAAWFDYLSGKTGAAGDFGWALLIFAALLAAAESFRRSGHPVSAGTLAFGAVAALAVSVSQLFGWLGWDFTEALRGLDLSRLLFALVWMAAAAVALRRYRFPLIVVQLVYASWFFVVDLLSNGGTWTAILTIALGFTSLLLAVMLDAVEQRAYAFWVHVGAGLMIGGGALWCVRNAGAVAWLLILVAAIGYIWIASVLGRSSWAVLGVLGIFITASYFALRWTRVSLLFFDNGRGAHPWVAPFVYSLAAALVLALGLWVSRRPAAG